MDHRSSLLSSSSSSCLKALHANPSQYLCLGHRRGHLEGVDGGEEEAARQKQEGKREARHHRVYLSDRRETGTRKNRVQ